jgi:exodeoxyribonuclease VII small subunit
MATNEKPTFEDAFTDLRAAVEALEAGNLSLEDASKLFEKGMQLAKQCNELLSKAELQVARLQRSFGEQMAMLQSAEADMLAQDDDENEDEDEDA